VSLVNRLPYCLLTIALAAASAFRHAISTDGFEAGDFSAWNRRWTEEDVLRVQQGQACWARLVPDSRRGRTEHEGLTPSQACPPVRDCKR
jgi:hypothetical protein